MTLLNKDKAVMEFFPHLLSERQTGDFILRMQDQFLKKGFCYFPVDHLETDQFIGFIGFSMQNFISDFTPCMDIGWRIDKQFWGKGLATEGAQQCIQFAKTHLKQERVFSMAPKININSIKVMEKIGMRHVKDFEHPKLMQYPKLKKCVLFDLEL